MVWCLLRYVIFLLVYALLLSCFLFFASSQKKKRCIFTVPSAYPLIATSQCYAAECEMTTLRDPVVTTITEFILTFCLFGVLFSISSISPSYISVSEAPFFFLSAHWHVYVIFFCILERILIPSLLRLTNKKSKCSNDPHSPYKTSSVISLTQSINITNIRVASCNFSTERLHKLQLSHDSLALSEHQDHLSWNQTEEF